MTSLDLILIALFLLFVYVWREDNKRNELLCRMSHEESIRQQEAVEYGSKSQYLRKYCSYRENNNVERLYRVYCQLRLCDVSNKLLYVS